MYYSKRIKMIIALMMTMTLSSFSVPVLSALVVMKTNIPERFALFTGIVIAFILGFVFSYSLICFVMSRINKWH